MATAPQSRPSRSRTGRSRPVRSSTAKQAVGQLLPLRSSHGGRRAGAGRQPNADRAGVPHDTRAALAAGCDRNGFRLTHYAVRNDRLHFVIEAAGRGRGLGAVVRPVTDARTWLLAIGWRRLRLLRVQELPATG